MINADGGGSTYNGGGGGLIYVEYSGGSVDRYALTAFGGQGSNASGAAGPVTLKKNEQFQSIVTVSRNVKCLSVSE